MSSVENQTATVAAQPLYVINRLCLKVIRCETLDALIFTVLNDMIHLIRYDRAVLWDMQRKKRKILGISGETSVNKDAAIVQEWESMLDEQEDLSRPNVISVQYSHQIKQSLVEEESKKVGKATVLWLPIFNEDKFLLGLWLEMPGDRSDNSAPLELMNFMMDLLAPAIGAAYDKLQPKYTPKRIGIGFKHYISIALATLLIGFFVKIPLRIVAPCEVVPSNPVLITAPLQGILERIPVQPGQWVSVGEPLFEYDKQVPLKQLEIARNEMEILQSEVKRAAMLGIEDERVRSEYAILELKLQKEKADYELAKYHAEQLTVKSPIDGIAMLENPEEWRGKPVTVGEKVLAVSDPSKTKVQMWLPENDNIPLLEDSDVRVFLNVHPSKSFAAKLLYIANDSVISEKKVPSFLSEAEWVDDYDGIKLGLKGTAVLYGEKVSLFYFVFRKPWAAFRGFFGI